MIFYLEETRRELISYKGINSWGDGIYGYKVPDTSRNTGMHYYVFTLYEHDAKFGLYPTNNDKGKLLRYMESMNVIRYGKLICFYQVFDRN